MEQEQSTVWLAGFDYSNELLVVSFDVEVTAKLVRRPKDAKGRRPTFGQLLGFRSQMDRDDARWSRDSALASLAAQLDREIQKHERQAAVARQQKALVDAAPPGPS